MQQDAEIISAHSLLPNPTNFMIVGKHHESEANEDILMCDSLAKKSNSRTLQHSTEAYKQ